MIEKDASDFLFKADIGCSSDLDKIERYMIWARNRFTSFFPNISIEKVTLEIYDRPKTINSGGIVNCCTMRSNPPNKKIYLLCPSACQNKTEEYYRKNLLHEYTHLFTWKRYAPSWFLEGIAEYVAIDQSDNLRIKDQYAYYYNGIKNQIQNGLLSFVNNMAYAWAMHLIVFLINFNFQKMQSLLLSNGPTFEDDLYSVYGFNLTQMMDAFWHWIEVRYSLTVEAALQQNHFLIEIDRHLYI